MQQVDHHACTLSAAPERHLCAVRSGPGGPSWAPATTTATTSAVAPAAPDLPAVVDVTEVDAQLPGGNGDWAMAVRGDVWVAGLGPGLGAFDGATGHRVAAVAAGPVYLGMEETEGPGRRAVWVRVTDALVARVDVRTKEVTMRIGPASGSGSVALSGRNVWITAHDVHHIWRVPGQ